jgi:hypothetical protein
MEVTLLFKLFQFPQLVEVQVEAHQAVVEAQVHQEALVVEGETLAVQGPLLINLAPD